MFRCPQLVASIVMRSCEKLRVGKWTSWPAAVREASVSGIVRLLPPSKVSVTFVTQRFGCCRYGCTRSTTLVMTA